MRTQIIWYHITTSCKSPNLKPESAKNKMASTLQKLKKRVSRIFFHVPLVERRYTPTFVKKFKRRYGQSGPEGNNILSHEVESRSIA
jgi:hypothetical protein